MRTLMRIFVGLLLAVLAASLIPDYCRPEDFDGRNWVPVRWGTAGGRTSCGPFWRYFGSKDGEWQGGWEDWARNLRSAVERL